MICHTLHRSLLATIVLILVLSGSLSSQTSKREPLPKLLSVREQQLVRESWLKK